MDQVFATSRRGPERSATARDGPLDEAAVRAMYRRYGRLVYAIAHRAVGRTDLAEEATRRTFVEVLRGASDVQVDRDTGTRLRTVAHRIALEIRARPRRDAATSNVDRTALDAAWRVRQAVEALPPQEATIIRLQHVDGLTHDEIARALGLAHEVVKRTSRHAHAQLSELLGHLRAAHPDA